MANWFRQTETGARLFLKVTPGAKQKAIRGTHAGADGQLRLIIQTTAAPEKGKANAAVIKLLAKAIGAPKTAFTVASGETARLKTLELRGQFGDLEPRLNVLAGDET